MYKKAHPAKCAAHSKKYYDANKEVIAKRRKKRRDEKKQLASEGLEKPVLTRS